MRLRKLKMRINPDSSIQLEEGEKFINECQDPGNIWRTSTLTLKSGAIVTVQRHFSQIGPIIIRPDGSVISTHVNSHGYVVPVNA